MQVQCCVSKACHTYSFQVFKGTPTSGLSHSMKERRGVVAVVGSDGLADAFLVDKLFFAQLSV